MMHCRTGTAESSGASPLKACDGPGSAAHRFARRPRPQIVQPLEYALALRRIRDTAALLQRLEGFLSEGSVP